MIRRRRWVLAGLAAALMGMALGATRVATRALPRLQENPTPRRVGAFHIHSEDSHDGSLTYDTLARAAQSAGLSFLIITDHNKQRARSVRLHGVTLISYAELSTGYGHVVGLGTRACPNKRQRAAPDVLEQVREAGGFAVVTHPADKKRPWSGSYTGAGGIEIANVSASARRYGGPFLLRLLPLAAAWPWQRALAMAQLYDRDEVALAVWDAQPEGVVGLCGSDTHGWIAPEVNLAAWSIVLDSPASALEPDADADADAIGQALREGRFHCSAGLLGHDPVFAFEALPGLVTTDVATLRLVGPDAGSSDAELVILKDGAPYRFGAPPELTIRAPEPGVYRGEVRVRLPHLLTGMRRVPVVYSQRLTLTGSRA